MSEAITFHVNGRPVRALPGTTVAAALLGAGVPALRQSVTGEPRGPICGMGVCFECRVTIDGIPHRLGCQTQCAQGMEVWTNAS
jgi:predicted molibdopterin-dependent oxidoreductase YjgC